MKCKMSQNLSDLAASEVDREMAQKLTRSVALLRSSAIRLANVKTKRCKNEIYFRVIGKK